MPKAIKDSNGRMTKYSRRRVLHGMAGGAGLAAAATAACTTRSTPSSRQTSSQGVDESPQAGGTLQLSQSSNVATLDPHVHAGTGINAGIYAAMSRPFRFKSGPDPQVALNHDVEPDVAMSAESPDAQTWTVKVRPGATFHNVAPVNGHPVEAEDIKATFTRAITFSQSTIRGAVDMVEPSQIETPAKDTVVFRLKYPYAPFAKTLASPNYANILPREILASSYDPAKQVIGSGAFIFDNYTPDVGISLKRNPQWIEKGRPFIDGVRLAIVPDRNQQLAQLSAGNLDLLSVQENDIGAAKQNNPKAAVITVTAGGDNVFYFGLGDPSSPFQAIRLRRAVSLAIDRNGIGKALYNDRYEPHFYVRLSLGKWAMHSKDLAPNDQQYYKFDLGQAKALLDQAGASKLDVKLVYFTGFSGPQQEVTTVAQAVYSMLKALPWTMTLSTIDYLKDFIGGGHGWRYGNIPADTMLYGGISLFSEVDEFLFGYYHSKSTSNQERLKDPVLDAMIDKARTIVDDDARRKAYIDVQNYLADKMYSIAGLPAGNEYTIVQPKIRNFNYVSDDQSQGDAWSALWLKS